MAKLAWITIPNCHRLDEIKVKIDNVTGSHWSSKHIICKATDKTQVSNYNQFVKDFKATVMHFHQTSVGNHRTPANEETVYWITVDYPSWIRSIHWKCSDSAPDQLYSPYNYYQTQKQVEDLLKRIQMLLKKYRL